MAYSRVFCMRLYVRVLVRVGECVCVIQFLGSAQSKVDLRESAANCIANVVYYYIVCVERKERCGIVFELCCVVRLACSPNQGSIVSLVWFGLVWFGLVWCRRKKGS
jgi:hypothetical protein